MSFATRGVRTSLTSINQGIRRKGTKEMIENRNVNIITDANGKKLVLINDIRFKGKRQIDWDDVKQYLEGYVGDYYEIAENAEHIFIGNELPEEYTELESRKRLMGANAKAKANAATAIPELIQIASNPAFEENRKEKHNKNVKYGWYRYDVRFALPVYEENVLVRYNIFHSRRRRGCQDSRRQGGAGVLTSSVPPATKLKTATNLKGIYQYIRSCSTISSALLLMPFIF